MRRIRFPLVFRKTMETELQRKDRILDGVRKEYWVAEEKIKSQLDEYLPKLIKFAFSYNPRFDNYMIQTALSTEMVRECFIHGDSQWMISMLAERLSRQLERELRTINFTRLREQGEHRWEGGKR